MELVSKTLDHEFRGVVAGNPEILKQINAFKYFRGLSSLKLMDEKIAFIPTGFMITRNHPLIEPYNEIIGRLQDAGITDYWINYEYNRRKNEKIENFGPQVLDMSHLEVCFYVCMFPLIFAFLAFLCELNAELFLHILRKLRDKLSSFCRPRTKHKIIQVRPVGYERKKTTREKLSSALRSLYKAVKVRTNDGTNKQKTIEDTETHSETCEIELINAE
jgi:hypothetical protein